MRTKEYEECMVMMTKASLARGLLLLLPLTTTDIIRQTYKLEAYNGINHLHGGPNKGLDKAVWAAKTLETDEKVGVVFTHTSLDGEEGYPGNLDVEVGHPLPWLLM